MHHGGFGKTAAGFKAWIPALMIPHIIDQFIWGNKVAELGVGPKPIARDKLTIENMANALVQIQSQEIVSKAAALGKSIRDEPDGVAVAIELIENSKVKTVIIKTPMVLLRAGRIILFGRIQCNIEN